MEAHPHAIDEVPKNETKKRWLASAMQVPVTGQW
jgi:hypothetical protein